MTVEDGEFGIFIENLESILAGLNKLDPANQDEIIPIGVQLEQLGSGIPDEKANWTIIFNFSLKALQFLYQGEFKNPMNLRKATCAALESILESAKSNSESESLFETGNELAAILGEDAPDWSAKIEDNQAEGSPLNDISAALVQVELNDLPELKRIHEALTEYIGQMGPEDHGKKKLTKAADILKLMADDKAEDPEGSLTEIGLCLDQAIYSQEENHIKESPKPKPVVSEELEEEPKPEPALKAASAPVEIPEEDESDSLPEDADRDILADFLVESREYVEGAEAALLTLETNPEDEESVNTVFRAFHTIKGTAAFLNLTRISEMAHRAESLLSRVRDHEIEFTGGYADLALKSIDVLKELLQSVENALGGDPFTKPADYNELMKVLANPEAAGVSGKSSENPSIRVGDILVAQGKVTREDVELAAACQGDQPIGEALVKANAVNVSDVAKAIRTQQKIKSSEHTVESSVRVRTDRLDQLIEMVGELVIAQSMVNQDDLVVSGQHFELTRKVTHAEKIVRELQDLSMSMRMVPFKSTFQKMTRLVRDLSHKTGKPVNFITEGEETEIDRNMVDALGDPLVHMVRNALDHGIELPEKRAAKGKPAEGQVRLSAYHQGGNVVVAIQDDGNGLDREKIVGKALSKGIISTDKGMTDSEVFNLIFEPGFSTMDKVTELSGRGVGMDVVKRAIESLHGRVEITSKKGQGSTFAMYLPLTLAITDGMLVKVGTERYIIPTVNINITFQPQTSSLSTIVGRGEMVMLRDELMPLFRLHRLFGVQSAVEDPTKGLLVVVGDTNRHCALLVDELLGQQQVVAKSLGEGIGVVPGISGGAILGDGRVGLILDTAKITNLAKQAKSH